METRIMNRIGAEVSLLGFGCMRLPQKDGAIDYDTAERMVDMALEGGITYFDNAYYYHDQTAEIFLGKALSARHPRSSYTIATKMPLSEIHEADDMEKILDLQLSRLKTDYVDFYMCHALKAEAYFDKFKPMDVVGFLKRMKKAGKIRHYGFSTHDKPEGVKKMLDDAEWEFVQLQLNYLDWTEQDAQQTYQNLVDRNIPCIVMEPIRGGGLVSMAEEPAQILKRLFPDDKAAAVALRWCGTLPGVKVILSGMSTPEQVRENLETFNAFQPLNDQEVDALREVVAALKSLPVIPCTECNYCNECPTGVAIPQIFSQYNNYIMFGNEQELTCRYEQFIPENNRAEDCTGCRVCVPLCPQNIDIPAELEKVARIRVKLLADR